MNEIIWYLYFSDLLHLTLSTLAPSLSLQILDLAFMKFQNKQPVSIVIEIRTMVPYQGGEGTEWKRA